MSADQPDVMTAAAGEQATTETRSGRANRTVRTDGKAARRPSVDGARAAAAAVAGGRGSTAAPTGPPAKQPNRRAKRGEMKAVRRARRVQRVVRHVDAWSVLKLSLLFYLCLFVVVMVAGIILWNLAAAIGTIDDIERLVTELGLFDSFKFEAGKILRATTLGGLILVIVGSGFNVLVVTMFNLISDLVGGIRITVIEEETARLPVAAPAAAPAPASAPVGAQAATPAPSPDGAASGPVVPTRAAASPADAPTSTSPTGGTPPVGGVQPAAGTP